MAINSISRAKLRSLLTMLGVIIGVVSVVMIFALGEGLKRQVSGELTRGGDDKISVRSGMMIERDEVGRVSQVNVREALASSTLSDADVDTIKAMSGVRIVAPESYLSLTISDSTNERSVRNASVIGTTPQIIDAASIIVDDGEFFSSSDTNRAIAIIGSSVAKELFGEDRPVGRVVKIRNIDYVVRGVLREQVTGPLDIVTTNYNDSVLIPMGSARELSGSPLAIREIRVRTDEGVAPQVVSKIDKALLELRQGSRDFSVLGAEDFVLVLGRVSGLITTFIGAVAGISLFVGGIGIMNVMLVAVSERTREIGIRKSIGATNQQILGQFLIEAVILTLLGGAIGVALAFSATGLLRLYTPLQPFIEWRVVASALGASLVVGVLFGMVPALKAARKDPIESLR